MTQKTKRIGLLLLAGVLVSLLFLAPGLSNLDLKSGNPSPFNVRSDQVSPQFEGSTIVPTNNFAFLQGFLSLSFLILLVYVSARLFLFANRKRVIPLTVLMVILVGLVYILPNTSFRQSHIAPGEFFGIAPPLADNGVVPSLGQPPMAIIWLIAAAFMLGMSVPLIKVFKERRGPTKIADPFVQEAEQAITALQIGLDLKDVILSCYIKMTQSILEEQGIERNHTMTVREFEDWLEQKGFPAAPVHQLTSLFEKVRYGTQPMDRNDEENAVNSLNEIIHFCRLSESSQ